jgi:hypothetical protein
VGEEWLVSYGEVGCSQFKLLFNFRMQEIDMGMVVGLGDVVFNVTSVSPLFMPHMMQL